VTRHTLALLASLLLCSPSYANFSMSPSGSTTLFAIDAANQGTSLCAASVTECAASVPINTAGAPLFTSAVPGQVGLNTSPTIANGNGVVPTIAGAVYSATNGAYFNQLQGNAVLSATNGGYQNILQGNAVLSTGNPIFMTGTGTAGTAATNPITVQGIASMTPLLANPGTIATWGLMSGTVPGTAPTNTLLTGGIYNSAAPTPSNGQTLPLQLTSGGSLHTTVDNTIAALEWNSDANATTLTGSQTSSLIYGYNGSTVDRLRSIRGSLQTVNGANFYQAVAASQTATVLQSSTGANGDYLSHCDVYPTSTSPGVVTVFDNTNTAANSAILFPGGATSMSNLVPFAIPVGAVSVNGAWKVTTGANVSVVCYGKFS
jgi:hypothetical protein